MRRGMLMDLQLVCQLLLLASLSSLGRRLSCSLGSSRLFFSLLVQSCLVLVQLCVNLRLDRHLLLLLLRSLLANVPILMLLQTFKVSLAQLSVLIS